MRWGRHWPDRVPRPKVRRLAKAENERILATFQRGIAASPVLSAFALEVRRIKAASTSSGNAGMATRPIRRSGVESHRWPLPTGSCFWNRRAAKEPGMRLPGARR